MPQNDYPRVGVAAIVLREGRLLLGRRKKSPGANTWQCPGGFLQKNESVFACARRQTLENTGVTIHKLRYGPYTNNRFEDHNQHTVTLYVLADYMSGDITSLQTEAADSWQWVAPSDLPRPLFLPVALLLEKHTDWLQSEIGISG